MKNKKLFKTGVFVLIASIVVPVLATVWFIRSAFEALRTNQTAGIGHVAAPIEYATIVAVAGIIGMVVGIVLMILGSRRGNRAEKLL